MAFRPKSLGLKSMRQILEELAAEPDRVRLTGSNVWIGGGRDTDGESPSGAMDLVRDEDDAPVAE